MSSPRYPIPARVSRLSLDRYSYRGIVYSKERKPKETLPGRLRSMLSYTHTSMLVGYLQPAILARSALKVQAQRLAMQSQCAPLPDQATMPDRLPKPPYQQDQYDQPQRAEGPVLLEQQLPIDPHRRALILRAVLPQPTAHVPHLLQTVSTIQQILDVLRHHLRDILELVVEPAEVVGRAGVLVGLLRALDIAIELAVGIGPELGIEVGGAIVGCLEFGADVFEVGESELLWVRALGDGDIGEGVVEDVAGGYSASVKRSGRLIYALPGVGGR